MGVSLFVLAAAIAVIGLLFVYKKNVDQIKANPTTYESVQQRFFVTAPIIEVVPIILIIVAFINQDTVFELEALFLPAAIIIGLMLFAIIFIFLQAQVDVDESSKKAVRQFSLIALLLVLAIPIVALVMMVISGDI